MLHGCFVQGVGAMRYFSNEGYDVAQTPTGFDTSGWHTARWLYESFHVVPDQWYQRCCLVGLAFKVVVTEHLGIEQFFT